MILAIDPGYEKSAWVLYDGPRLGRATAPMGVVVEHAIESNIQLLRRISGGTWHVGEIDVAVIEQIESFGMAVGREVFETVFWTGRFHERCRMRALAVERIPRKAVKLHLCHSARATDSNIRVALVDRFGGTEKAVGKKANPGPLYGIKSHEWSALAIAVVWHEQSRAPSAVGF